MTQKKLVKLTPQSLNDLKKRGFRYVVVEGFTNDGRADYIEMTYFLLTPVKDLQDRSGEQGVYTSIDSEMLQKWAVADDGATAVYIQP